VSEFQIFAGVDVISVQLPDRPVAEAAKTAPDPLFLPEIPENRDGFPAVDAMIGASQRRLLVTSTSSCRIATRRDSGTTTSGMTACTSPDSPVTCESPPGLPPSASRVRKTSVPSRFESAALVRMTLPSLFSATDLRAGSKLPRLGLHTRTLRPWAIAEASEGRKSPKKVPAWMISLSPARARMKRRVSGAWARPGITARATGRPSSPAGTQYRPNSFAGWLSSVFFTALPPSAAGIMVLFAEDPYLRCLHNQGMLGQGHLAKGEWSACYGSRLHR
jgi:hypothetical protein